MKILVHITFFIILCVFSSHNAYSLARPDREFKIFQFPADQIPRIDGDTSDWNIVPDDYAVGIDEVVDLRFGTKVDKKDLDAKVKVGWVKGESRLYFLYEAYDDVWVFDTDNLVNDIFEIIVDADLSGGPMQKQLHPESDYVSKEKDARIGDNELHYRMHGVHGQNYHVFTPPGQKDWCFVWGVARWAKFLPYSNCAYSYNFKHGEGGKLVAEFFITPFDHATAEGSDTAVISTLEENKIIGLNWGMNDYDNPENRTNTLMDAQFNLSHNEAWYGIGSDLCAFRLMPLEEKYIPKIKAFADFEILDMDKGIVAFKDYSIGKISKYTWDFGDSTSSNEPNPIHTFKGHGGKHVKFTVEGPEGTAFYSFIYEEIFIK